MYVSVYLGDVVARRELQKRAKGVWMIVKGVFR